jgi:hypothetical protein
MLKILPSVSRVSKENEGLDISQPYGPPLSVTGIALPSFFNDVHYVVHCKWHLNKNSLLRSAADRKRKRSSRGALAATELAGFSQYYLLVGNTAYTLLCADDDGKVGLKLTMSLIN